MRAVGIGQVSEQLCGSRDVGCPRVPHGSVQLTQSVADVRPVRGVGGGHVAHAMHLCPDVIHRVSRHGGPGPSSWTREHVCSIPWRKDDVEMLPDGTTFIGGFVFPVLAQESWGSRGWLQIDLSLIHI